MKIPLLIISFILSVHSYGQINRYSTYTPGSYEPRSFDEIMSVSKLKYSKAQENKAYLRDFKEAILKIRPKILSDKHKKLLTDIYKDLVKIENKDLSNAEDYLQTMEGYMAAVLSDYYKWIERQDNNTSASYTSSSSYSSKKYHEGARLKTNMYAPILDTPSANGKRIGTVKEDKATVISVANDKYYKVKSGETEGYLSTEWIKYKIY